MRINFSRKTFEVNSIYVNDRHDLYCYMDCPPYYYIVVRFEGLTLKSHDRYMYNDGETWSVKKIQIRDYAIGRREAVLNNSTLPFSVLADCFAIRNNYADKL